MCRPRCSYNELNFSHAKIIWAINWCINFRSIDLDIRIELMIHEERRDRYKLLDFDAFVVEFLRKEDHVVFLKFKSNQWQCVWCEWQCTQMNRNKFFLSWNSEFVSAVIIMSKSFKRQQKTHSRSIEFTQRLCQTGQH